MDNQIFIKEELYPRTAIINSSPTDYTDREVVDGLITNDPTIIRYLFYMRCNKLFRFIIASVFDDRVCQDELISELFLYIAQKDWEKVRQFDFRSSFYTWLSVVAIRFFQKMRSRLLDIKLPEALINYMKEEKLLSSSEFHHFELIEAINKMENPRYREAIIQLDVNDKEPKEVAEIMGITVANLYNLHRRALISLRNLYINDEYYR